MRLQLSEHFRERWQQRVGNWPSPAFVRRILREAVKVQHCKDMREKDGSAFRMLAIYWHPALNLVIKVDHIAGQVVSVLSEDNFQPERLKCTAKRTTAK